MLRRGRTPADEVIDGRASTGGVRAGLVPAPRHPRPAPSTHPPPPASSWTGTSGDDRRQEDRIARLEAELSAQRRVTDELVGRYRDCLADLELSRRLLAHSAEGQHLLDVSQQAGRLLATAADQAAEVAAAGAAEAHRLVAEARVAAQNSLDRTRVLRGQVLELCGSMRRQAQQDRAEARDVLARARRTAEQLLREAEAEAGRSAGPGVLSSRPAR